MKSFAKVVAMALLAGSSLLSTSVVASTLTLPTTMDAGSVQAKLKALLFSKLEAGGEITGPFQANLTGSYSAVTLEDDDSRVTCREFSAGQLAVQQFECRFEIKNGQDDEVVAASLSNTMNSASVQAVIKELLFAELEAHGPVTAPYEAQLTGAYSEVTLEDEQAKLVCLEHGSGMLAVQTFSCHIGLN